MPKIVTLLGRGRSGTSWIGKILNQFPGCLYRYEPFNPNKKSPYLDWLNSFPTHRVKDITPWKKQFNAISQQAFHQIDYPPFHQKWGRPQSPLILRATWQMGKWLPPLRPIYEQVGAPDLLSLNSLLIKQVNFPNERLPMFCEILDPQLITVIRNPFASVSSSLRFYGNEDPRTPKALHRVQELIELPEYTHYRPFLSELSSLSIAAFEALRWRLQTEPLVSITKQKNGKIVTHEQCCLHPMETFEQLYRYLLWPFTTEVEQAIVQSTREKKSWIAPWRRQYSLQQNPEEVLQKWKQHLNAQDIEQIKAIVETSPLLSYWEYAS